MAPNGGGSPLLVFILGGLLMITAVVGVVMLSGRVPEEIASSRSADVDGMRPFNLVQPST